MISTKPERESCQWLADEFGGMATWQGTGIKKAQPVRVVVMGALGRLEVGDWRVHSGSLCPSQQWPSARERASGRVWAGRNGAGAVGAVGAVGAMGAVGAHWIIPR